MKIGDLVKYKSEYIHHGLIGIIVAVGYGGEYTDTDQCVALHPDIWVLVSDGEKQRWNEHYVDVVSEAR
jgi:hypothetical protein